MTSAKKKKKRHAKYSRKHKLRGKAVERNGRIYLLMSAKELSVYPILSAWKEKRKGRFWHGMNKENMKAFVAVKIPVQGIKVFKLSADTEGEAPAPYSS